MRFSVVCPVCVVVPLLVSLSGCGGVKEPTAPVKGLVTIEGKPLAGGTVVFEPDAQRGNASKHEFRAAIDPANPGLYELLRDGKDAQSDAKGVSLGWYKVAIFAIKPSLAMTRPVWLADRKYANTATSRLSAEVVANPGKDAYDFDLKRGGPR